MNNEKLGKGINPKKLAGSKLLKKSNRGRKAISLQEWRKRALVAESNLKDHENTTREQETKIFYLDKRIKQQEQDYTELRELNTICRERVGSLHRIIDFLGKHMPPEQYSSN